MSIKNIKLLFLLLFVAINAYSQQEFIKGKIIDKHCLPIEYATVILQSEDQSYQGAFLTDSVGNFVFDKIYDRNYLLIIQHVAYVTDTLKIGPENKIPTSLVLLEKNVFLNELVVTSERPLIEVKDNTFIYNIRPLLKNKIALNAYEAVKEIPGVIELGGTLSLAGSENLKIVIDGQITSLSLQQILRLLKSTSSARVDKIEISYNAPAKYNTNGALINVVLKANTNKNQSFTGELEGTYLQSYYPSVNQNIGLSYNKNKLRLDLFGNFSQGKSWNKSIASTRQSVGNNQITIDENTHNAIRYLAFNPRIGLNYSIDEDRKVVCSYYLEANKNTTNNYSNAIFKERTESNVTSLNESKNSDCLNNFYLEYSTKELTIGTDVILYNNSTDRTFKTQENGRENGTLYNNSTQKIRKYTFFFNHNIKPIHQIKLAYGINLGYNKAGTDVNYYSKESGLEDEYHPVKGKQTEYHINSYIEAKYRVSPKLFISSSVKTEYFNSTYNNNGIRSLLWNGWTFYPKASLTYTVNAKKNIQFTLSSNKRYPSFWAVNPQTTNLSAYTQIEGNPHLKPYKSYLGRLLYSYKRKYMFSIAFQTISNYFMQMPHMSEDRLKIIHRYENFDNFYRIQGMAVLPFQIGDDFNSRLTLQGYRTHEKIDSFYGSSINTVYFNGIVSLSNSLKLSPSLALQVNGNYHSPSKQGVYKLGSRWGLDSRLEWKTNARLSFVLRYENILQHQIPRPLEVIYSNQYRWSRDYEKSRIGISVLWRFNQYKAENYKSPDNSRLEQ